jgi:predicted metal-binding membrane protein
MTTAGLALDRLLRRDRIVVLTSLAVVVVLAWAYLLFGMGMEKPAMQMAAVAAPWTFGYAGLMLVMWALMMVAMMLPSAAPMLLLFATLSRRGGAGATSQRKTGAFAIAYVCVWTAFALFATGVQWTLDRAMLLSPGMAVSSATVAGALFVAAGVYQFLPLKQACLRHCRSPMEFLAGHWRPDVAGAFEMGLRHGAFCLGCCWVLMGLLFVGGVMNTLWIAALSLIVFIEKVAPAGPLAGRMFAFGLVAWGLGIIVTA